MANKCPNLTSPEALRLLEVFDKNSLYKIYIENNDELPSMYEVEEIIRKSSEEIFNRTLRPVLTNMGVSVESFDRLVTKFGSVNALADISNKTLKYVKGQEKHLPEEVGHFILGMIEDSALVQRVLNLASQSETFKEVSEEYSIAYNNDQKMLQLETAGKLLGQYLTKQSFSSKESPSLISRLKDTLSLIWNRIRSILGKMDSEAIQREIDRVYGKLAKNASSASYKELGEGLFYNLGKGKMTPTEYVEQMVKIIQDKMKFYKKLGGDEFEANLAELNQKLEESIEKDAPLVGIIDYLSRVQSEVVTVLKELDNYLKKGIDFQKEAKYLKTMKNYISGHRDIISRLALEIVSEDNPELKKVLKDTGINVIELDKKIQLIMDKFYEVATPAFIEFMKKSSGFNSYDLDKFGPEIAKSIQLFDRNDLSFFSKFLETMEDSGHIAFTIFDKIYKVALEKARLSHIANYHTSMELLENFQKAGFKQKDLIEHHKGEPTHYIISKYNQGKFDEAKRNFFANHKKPKLEDFKNEEEYTKALKSYREAVGIWFANNTQLNPEYEKLAQDYYKELLRVSKDKATADRKFKTWKEEHFIYDLESDSNELVSVVNSPTTKQFTIPSDLYLNKDFETRMKNPAYKAMYDKLMTLHREAQSKLPWSYRKGNMRPMIRKSMLNTMMEKSGIKGKWQGFKQRVKDTFIKNEQDLVEFGLKDESGNKLNFIPIYFTDRIENAKDISEDMVEAIFMESYMADEYYELTKIIYQLEVGKDILNESRVVEYSGKKKIVLNGSTQTKSFSATEYAKRLDNWFEMNLYGQRKKDEGTILGIDAVKATDFLMRYSGLRNLALNLGVVIGNFTTSMIQKRLEAFGSSYLDHTSINKAIKDSPIVMASLIKDIKKKHKKSKINAFAEQFNILQNYDRARGNTDKSGLARFMSVNTLMIPNEIANQEPNVSLGIALANNYRYIDGKWLFRKDYFKQNESWNNIESNIEEQRSKLKNKLKEIDEARKTGKDISGLEKQAETISININNLNKEQSDAVKKISEKWNNAPSLNSVYSVDSKGSFTLPKEYPMTEEERFRFQTVHNSISHQIYGVYDQVNSTMSKQSIVGRASTMYRGWLFPGLLKRFGKRRIDTNLEEEKEGIFTSTRNFLSSLPWRKLFAREVKQFTSYVKMNWNAMDSMEKANVKKATAEIATILTLMGLIMMLGYLDDDEEANSWPVEFMSYMLYRTYSETSSFINPVEFARIVNSPIPAMNSVEDIMGFVFGLLNPKSWTHELESGKYQGWTEVEKEAFNLLPFLPQLKTWSHPGDIKKYYQGSPI